MELVPQGGGGVGQIRVDALVGGVVQGVCRRGWNYPQPELMPHVEHKAPLGPPSGSSPRQQGSEVVCSGGVWADWGRCHKGRGLRPVLAPVVRAVGAQAGSGGLPEHNHPCREAPKWHPPARTPPGPSRVEARALPCPLIS